jgi:hypothetical protein
MEYQIGKTSLFFTLFRIWEDSKCEAEQRSSRGLEEEEDSDEEDEKYS